MTDQVIYNLGYVEHLSYIGLFLAVGLSGYLIPIPEEVILIIGGFIAAQGITDLSTVILISVLGAIFGDTLIYYLSGHGSRFTHKYHKYVEQSHVGWYVRHMRQNPMLTIFYSRFIVGVRFLNPLVAGLMRIPWRKFVVATGLSAVIYIPCIILLGYIFHAQIYFILHIAHSVRIGILSLLAIGSAILILLFFRNLVEKWR
jgi:membrane protein DedA with SNARE-associated domain